MLPRGSIGFSVFDEHVAICVDEVVARADWTQGYDAGHTDGNGAYAGGSEIMHLIPHKGKLYAANGYGLRYMKGNILQSVTFTRDEFGKLLPQSKNLLVMAAGAYTGKHGVVSAWVRDDAAGTWNHGIVKYGSHAGGIRWIPRDMEVYRDKVTGAERLFLLIGNPGMYPAVHPVTGETVHIIGFQGKFIGGHDASSNSSDDMAWIFKASLDVVLGLGGDR